MASEPGSYLERSKERLLQDLEKRIRSRRVLAAFAEVPREAFVPATMSLRAYEDRALPIGEGQTISQPTMIAIMLEALDLHETDRVLEVGAGCGYAAALLGRLAAEVHAVERIPALAAAAERTLAREGFTNVRVHVGDGTLGLPSAAPFDGILVSAGAKRIPDELVRQLAPGGRIAIPVGDDEGQVLHVGRKTQHAGANTMEWMTDISCVFVPLIGA